ncbi:hypothetical protein HYDPIDRAFT_115404 [Hydnomerulius pinastri MD-312]|uniref:Uncharacterized protein n=1 Tax=Hydnomerulius pinastri MD-312 TaxID=994086 RepID=A0A0C9V892_9AGAM|nr:hypothetical protein HYDPIDRAFT_115404 [Hydnomerulius pinastri MD-312]
MHRPAIPGQPVGPGTSFKNFGTGKARTLKGPTKSPARQRILDGFQSGAQIRLTRQVSQAQPLSFPSMYGAQYSVAGHQ